MKFEKILSPSDMQINAAQYSNSMGINIYNFQGSMSGITFVIKMLKICLIVSRP